MKIRTAEVSEQADPLLARLNARPEPWMQQAVCAQTDPEVWFPEKGGTTEPAKKICREDCDVRAECLDHALRHHERFGIWGGMSERERRPLHRKWDAAHPTRVACAWPGCDVAATEQTQWCTKHRKLRWEQNRGAA